MPTYHLSETKYRSLPLSEDLQSGIQEAGYEFCTPIQALTLPIALEGKDVSGQAQTGTGKTAAFLIASLERLNRKDQLNQKDCESDDITVEADTKENKSDSKKRSNSIRALMIAPTRELAKQIFDDAKPLNKHLGYKLALAYGGTDYDKQRNVIEKGCDILIGTPGRIIDYFKQKVFSLNDLEVLVMDEADRMFDMGFIADIRYLLRAMPEPANRQSLLFSATMSERVKELAYEHMNSPETVVVEAEQVTADKIEQVAYMPANEDKIPLTLGILKSNYEGKSIIFVNTKHQGETIQAWLESNDFQSGLLSGDVPQKKRERLLKKFKDGQISMLVATDVAARGLHIDGVDVVINFDLPNDAEDYVHRIGRTARAGASGKAISLVCETYGMNIMEIESYIDNKIPINKNDSELILTELKTPVIKAKKPNKSSKATDKKDQSRPNRQQRTRPNKQNNNKTSTSKNTRVSEEISETMPRTKNRQRYMRRSKVAMEVPLIG